jgi:hypothetical protein
VVISVVIVPGKSATASHGRRSGKNTTGTKILSRKSSLRSLLRVDSVYAGFVISVLITLPKLLGSPFGIRSRYIKSGKNQLPYAGMIANRTTTK